MNDPARAPAVAELIPHAHGMCLLAAVLLLAMGKSWMALFLAIWGVVVVGLVL